MIQITAEEGFLRLLEAELGALTTLAQVEAFGTRHIKTLARLPRELQREAQDKIMARAQAVHGEPEPQEEARHVRYHIKKVLGPDKRFRRLYAAEIERVRGMETEGVLLNVYGHTKAQATSLGCSVAVVLNKANSPHINDGQL